MGEVSVGVQNVEDTKCGGTKCGGKKCGGMNCGVGVQIVGA